MIKIYKITCLPTNKKYVGQTIRSLKDRFNDHYWSRNKISTKFMLELRKFNKKDFIIELIEELDNQEEANNREIYWINYYDSINNGYNSKSTIGKCGGDTLTNNPNMKEISKKISESKLGDKNPMRINGGLKGEKNGMFGITPKNARKCVSININTNKVKVFKSIKELQIYHNVTTDCMVISRCKGQTKSPYKGYIFKYYEDYIEGQSTIESITREKDFSE